MARQMFLDAVAGTVLADATLFEATAGQWYRVVNLAGAYVFPPRAKSLGSGEPWQGPWYHEAALAASQIVIL
jgi:hypothetical protein